MLSDLRLIHNRLSTPRIIGIMALLGVIAIAACAVGGCATDSKIRPWALNANTSVKHYTPHVFGSTAHRYNRR